jgi:regulator of protease activity HflC (stomatin/prohibitin superfamily)
MTVSSKRAEYLSIFSLILSLVFFIIAFLLGLWSGFFAVFSVSWLILCSSLMWLVLLIQFHHRALAEQEKLDVSQIAQKESASTIFQTKTEQGNILEVAQRRLALLEKWFLPIFSAIIAIYEVVIGLLLIKVLMGGLESAGKQQPLVCAVSMVAIAFTSFLISRYATGMSSQLQWRPLKAGGSILNAAAILSFVIAIALAMQHFHYPVVLEVVGWITPVLMIVLGAETALNVVMDIYRPRLKGQYSRSAFDSRLLGVINEPGGILHTAASAIDYQFGFKVSHTWFYKLLEKAIVPLVLFGVVSLYLLSCIVVVNPDEQGIIERFGNPIKSGDKVKIYEPGLTFKWPWPVDKVYKYPTSRIMELSIGYKPKIDPRTGQEERSPKLWGQKHYQEEYMLLVASEQAGTSKETDANPFSLVIAAVPVQYRVKDLYSFLYHYGKYTKEDGSTGYTSEKMLESICYKELTRYAASSEIEVEGRGSGDVGLLGGGRVEAKKILTERIQKASDQAGLGVEIVFVGLQGIHPPVDVSGAFQDVVGAVQDQQTLILLAEAERYRRLNLLAGSVSNCDYLYRLAGEYKLAGSQNDTEKKEQVVRQLDSAFERVSGKAYTKIRNAKGYAFQRARLAKGRGERFAGQIKAYEAAPDYYIHQLWMNTYEQNLKEIRKYVIIADPKQYQIEQIDLTEQILTGLPDVEIGGNPKK